MEDYERKCSSCRKIYDAEHDDATYCDICKKFFCPKCNKKNPVKWVEYELAMCLKCFKKQKNG